MFCCVVLYVDCCVLLCSSFTNLSIIVSPLFVPVVLQKPIFMIANPEAETISLILNLAHLVSIKYQGQFSWIWKTINFECFCNWGPKLRQRCKPERRDAQNCNVNTLETLFSKLQTLLSLRCTARHCTVPFQLLGTTQCTLQLCSVPAVQCNAPASAEPPQRGLHCTYPKDSGGSMTVVAVPMFIILPCA